MVVSLASSSNNKLPVKKTGAASYFLVPFLIIPAKQRCPLLIVINFINLARNCAVYGFREILVGVEFPRTNDGNLGAERLMEGNVARRIRWDGRLWHAACHPLHSVL